MHPSPHRPRIAKLLSDGQERTAPQIQQLMPDIRLRIISATLYRMSDAGELTKSGSGRNVTYRAAGVTVPVDIGPLEDGCALARAWRRAGERGDQYGA